MSGRMLGRRRRGTAPSGASYRRGPAPASTRSSTTPPSRPSPSTQTVVPSPLPSASALDPLRPEASGELPLGRVDLHAVARRAATRAALLGAVAAIALGLFALFGGRASELLGAGAQALRADWRWAIAAVVFELLSFAGYIALFRLVAGRATTRVGLRASAEITFAGAATTRLLPTAGLGGVALTVWALCRAGLSLAEASARVVGFLYLLYSIYMAALILSGIALIGGLSGANAPPSLAIVGATVGTLVATAALTVGRGGEPPELDPPRHRRAAALRAKLAELRPAIARGRGLAIGIARQHPPQLLGALAWWGFDLAVLWSTFHAFGSPLPLIPAVMAYFLGTLANTLPIPGAVSTSMVAVHFAFGLPLVVVVPAVLAYRAIALWLPALGGALALGGLRQTTRTWAAETPA